jgi:hypothetical protein
MSRTLETIQEELDQKGWDRAFVDLPPEEITLELCEMAVERNPRLFKYFPKQFKTYKLCFRTCTLNGDMLEFVPDEFKTEELCMTAIVNFHWSTNLCFVPDEKKTLAMCELSVEQHGNFALKFVPERFLTQDLLKKVKVDQC